MVSLWRSTATACSPSGFQRFACLFLYCIAHFKDLLLVLVTDPVSQSGKLVTKMFQKIQQLIDDKDALVFVLIDEVIYARHILYLVCFLKSSMKSCCSFDETVPCLAGGESNGSQEGQPGWNRTVWRHPCGQLRPHSAGSDQTVGEQSSSLCNIQYDVGSPFHTLVIALGCF